jgi:hypothetical protein
MKAYQVISAVALMVVLGLSSCGTHKKTVKETQTVTTDTVGQKDFLTLVHNSSSLKTQYVSSKLKFTLEVGPQKVNLTGNLRMKRDDVIRLQLMAFGFVEAGRMEFTKDYVLIVDRINKQYLKAPYKYVDFLRNSGINFHTLQALFWNELFIPGNEGVDHTMLDNFTTDMGGDEAVIYLERGKINYSWLANQTTGRIKMANIMYRDPYNGNTLLNWNYAAMGSLNGKPFPNEMIVTLTSPKKEVKMDIKLNYLGTDDGWETRTEISEKYREVTPDQLLSRIMGSF